MGKSSCDLTPHANPRFLGQPCTNPPASPQLIVRVSCSSGNKGTAGIEARLADGGGNGDGDDTDTPRHARVSAAAVAAAGAAGAAAAAAAAAGGAAADRYLPTSADAESSWTATVIVTVTVSAVVPGGSVGEVHVPMPSGTTAGTITESGVVVWKNGAFVTSPAAVGVHPGGEDGRFVWFFVSAGNFSFAASASAAA